MSASSSSSASDSSSPPSTSPSTPPLSPKIGSQQVLPSPFFPPTLSQAEGVFSAYEADPLPVSFPSLPSKECPEETDEQTKGTPDSWVVRDSRLVRLTGKWPFNVEPPLPDLWNAGFLTPTRLFYVRNHGVVPKVTAEEGASWTFDISGLVKNSCTLSLADLIDPSKFRTVTLPVTLVCAGNRRKEQNVVAKSLGFSWGPAGLSTALFTGVYLADVLDYVQPQVQEGRRPEHVIFEGAEDLPNGKYGTSQRLRWARQKEKGMLLAWAMNGEALEPDHGFPLRLVVPGQIGGRSVKWLKKIEVSDKESQHHLHFWDNKVLPMSYTAEEARNTRDIWYDPKYIINDLNVNSAVARPAHDEQLVLPPASSDSSAPPATYTVQGYCYAGGGRRVTRIDVTLDDGKTWKLADLIYPEDQYRSEDFQGKVWGKIDTYDRDECFCWAFWRIEVPVTELKESACLAVRGMDESLALAPRDMYWNPTGMMNNWWFRVAIHRSTNSVGEDTLTFEHPTMPGLQPGGWMERMKENGEDPARPSFVKVSPEDEEIAAQSKQAAAVKKSAVVMTKPGVDRKITRAELEAHNKEEMPWFVVHGEVYDGLPFLNDHPGGAESITLVAGEDCTDDFMAIHSVDAKMRLADFHIGTLVEEDQPSSPPIETAPVEFDPNATFLDKKKWKGAKLVSIDYVNHDSRLYRFALDHLDQPLGLPVGQHVYARLRRKVCPGDAEATGADKQVLEGELVQRAYTPVSRQGARGYLDLLIKVYFRTSAFPEGGKMTLGFEELQVGDIVEFKGPLGSFEWIGSGACRWRGVQRNVKHIGMICGGSGITPILQVLRGVLHDTSDTTTTLHILNANKTEADILCRAELEELQGTVPLERFRQHFVLSKGGENWPFSRGRITKGMLEEHLPPPGDDSLVLFCGPDPMLNEIVKPGLAELGWDVPSQLVVF
ncbi:hypothetical protein JCM11251_003085 [Rhodosporidiobolus azoricus]